MAIYSFFVKLFAGLLVHLQLTYSETKNITQAMFAFVEVVNSSLFYQSYIRQLF